MATASASALASSHFFEKLSRRHPGVLVIDYESTIARLGRADCVFPYPTVEELLDRITMTGTRVIVTTRTPEELRAKFAVRAEIWPTSKRAALDSVAGGTPLAYVTGEMSAVDARKTQRLRVRPQYRLGTTKPTGAPAEEMVQFLMEWLRACTR